MIFFSDALEGRAVTVMPESASLVFDKKIRTGVEGSDAVNLSGFSDAAISFMGATLDLDMFRSVFAKGTRYFKEPQVFDAASTECLAPVCTHETSQGIYTFQF